MTALFYFDGRTNPAPTHPIARTAPQGMKNPRSGKSAIKRYSHAAGAGVGYRYSPSVSIEFTSKSLVQWIVLMPFLFTEEATGVPSESNLVYFGFSTMKPGGGGEIREHPLA